MTAKLHKENIIGTDRSLNELSGPFGASMKALRNECVCPHSRRRQCFHFLRCDPHLPSSFATVPRGRIPASGRVSVELGKWWRPVMVTAISSHTTDTTAAFCLLLANGHQIGGRDRMMPRCSYRCEQDEDFEGCWSPFTDCGHPVVWGMLANRSLRNRNDEGFGLHVPLSFIGVLGVVVCCLMSGMMEWQEGWLWFWYLQPCPAL